MCVRATRAWRAGGAARGGTGWSAPRVWRASRAQAQPAATAKGSPRLRPSGSLAGASSSLPSSPATSALGARTWPPSARHRRQRTRRRRQRGGGESARWQGGGGACN
eukprot:2339988-Rhodomonas_salina.1